jgi:hypothetical protein
MEQHKQQNQSIEQEQQQSEKVSSVLKEKSFKK